MVRAVVAGDWEKVGGRQGDSRAKRGRHIWPVGPWPRCSPAPDGAISTAYQWPANLMLCNCYDPPLYSTPTPLTTPLLYALTSSTLPCLPSDTGQSTPLKGVQTFTFFCWSVCVLHTKQWQKHRGPSGELPPNAHTNAHLQAGLAPTPSHNVSA